MNAADAKTVAAALFTAAGRHCGEAEHMVWTRALARIPGDGALAVVDRILETVDLGARGAPTPALFLAARSDLLRERRALADRAQPALDAPTPEDGPRRVSELRRLLASSALLGAERRRPAHDRPAPPRPRAQRQCCALGDHSRCADGPIRADGDA